MDEILQNAAGEIRLELRDETGALVNADSAPSVVVVDGAGEQVLAAGGASSSSTGIYTRTVPASETGILDRYEATWTVVKSAQTNIFKTHYEVVGGFYFSIGEARAYDGAKLSNTTTYPNQAIVDAREQIESEIEARARVAFVPRGRRVTVSGSGMETLLLPDSYVRRIVSGSVSDTALTPTQVSDLIVDGPAGLLWTAGVWHAGHENVVLHYEHGYDEVPAQIKKLALSLLVRRLASTATSAVGVKSESVGSYSVTYGDGGAMDLSDGELDVIDYFRAPVLG